MSIFWAIQNSANRIGKVDLANPGNLLGERETAIFRQFKIYKRQSEWLGARLAVKDLLFSIDPRLRGFEYHQVEVLNEPSGSPILQIDTIQGFPGKISLSHSHDYAFCAYSPGDIPLGVDMEWIEPRGMEMVEDFFAPSEIRQVLQTGEPDRSRLVTLIWSCKEAVLKAHSTGLRVDTRSVEILFPGQEEQIDGWNVLAFNSRLAEKSSLRLLWRREENFILTVCLPIEHESQLTRFKY